MKTAVLMATGAVGLLALTVADAAYRVRDWGAADSEVAASLPGDELVPRPADVQTLAVGVSAPASVVWQELLLFVAPSPDGSAVEPVPGDVVRHLSGPRHGFAEGPLEVVSVVPGRSLVLVPVGPGAGDVRGFHVVPGVSGRCRLLCRRRLAPGGFGRVVTHAVEPVAVVLTRLLMLKVAERAEIAARGGEGQPSARDAASR
ncbi:MAG: hypothetical protein QG622_2194 [Actinomycetota bacterium]|nr:hypothetical protein [Actinomycetota bacterium]